MLRFSVTLAHHLALSDLCKGFVLILFRPSAELPPPWRTPFLSYHSRFRARNSFPLIDLQKTRGILPSWSDQSASLTAKGYRLGAACFPLSPFAATLTQKQGGTGYWSYQPASLLTVSCRLLASPSYSPPCPTTHFPLQWEYPFPVITGENQ